MDFEEKFEDWEILAFFPCPCGCRDVAYFFARKEMSYLASPVYSQGEALSVIREVRNRSPLNLPLWVSDELENQVGKSGLPAHLPDKNILTVIERIHLEDPGLNDNIQAIWQVLGLPTDRQTH